MDHFGIGAALQGAARIYFQSARRTGRTTALLQSLKEGDRVIVATQAEYRQWQRLIVERQLNVDVRLFRVDRAHELCQLGTSQGRTLFEHTWVEQFYLHRLQDAATCVDELQQRLSGWGEAHEKTRQQAAEMMRWESSGL